MTVTRLLVDAAGIVVLGHIAVHLVVILPAIAAVVFVKSADIGLKLFEAMWGIETKGDAEAFGEDHPHAYRVLVGLVNAKLRVYHGVDDYFEVISPYYEATFGRTAHWLARAMGNQT